MILREEVSCRCGTRMFTLEASCSRKIRYSKLFENSVHLSDSIERSSFYLEKQVVANLFLANVFKSSMRSLSLQVHLTETLEIAGKHLISNSNDHFSIRLVLSLEINFHT